jgi:thiol-disulfide isomerase/thioredoxin
VASALALAAACASSPARDAAQQPARAAGAELPNQTAEVVVSLRDIPCQSCLRGSAKALLAIEGIEAAEVERDAAAVRVRYDPSVVDEPIIVATVTDLGYATELGEGAGSYLPDTRYDPGMDVEIISAEGEAVDIEAHRVPGKITVVDFFAEWCGPCRAVDNKLIELMRASDDLAVRRVNVADETSPAAQRYLGGDESLLPLVVIYDPAGKEVDRIEGFDLERLVASIAKARG